MIYENCSLNFLFTPLTAPNTLFLDRDGVLNEIVIRNHQISSPRNIQEFIVCEDINALLSSYFQNQWNLVIVTNQPDLTRGLIDLRLLEQFHLQIRQILPINGIYICPHLRSDECDCRKPKDGMIQAFRNEFSHLAGKELFIGDREVDRLCAQTANIPFVLRKKDHNQEVVEKSKWAIDHFKELANLIAENKLV